MDNMDDMGGMDDMGEGEGCANDEMLMKLLQGLMEHMRKGSVSHLAPKPKMMAVEMESDTGGSPDSGSDLSPEELEELLKGAK